MELKHARYGYRKDAHIAEKVDDADTEIELHLGQSLLQLGLGVFSPLPRLPGPRLYLRTTGSSNSAVVACRAVGRCGW